jgi:hypothetical protein
LVIRFLENLFPIHTEPTESIFIGLQK